MQVPVMLSAMPTPPNPIPVMVTGPDGSCRRESINMPLDAPSSFYAQNETTIEEHVERSKDQEDYDRVLQDINATLR
ncbi:hypothetical protein X777_00040, partial [Ooceraea biroi]